MHLTPDLQHHVAQAASEQALCNLAQQQGMRTLIQDGWLKAQQGLTSIEEISHLGTDV
jgi:type II secretory ATPase GspE/PulE/Tfp pilus assembly ATPase PilB-like protein